MHEHTVVRVDTCSKHLLAAPVKVQNDEAWNSQRGGEGGMRGGVRVHFDLARQKPKIGRSGYLLVKRVSRNATRRRPGKRVITVSRLVKCRIYIYRLDQNGSKRYSPGKDNLFFDDNLSSIDEPGTQRVEEEKRERERERERERGRNEMKMSRGSNNNPRPRDYGGIREKSVPTFFTQGLVIFLFYKLF